MRAEFSEFTFGFSLVSELAHLLGCRAVPVFPSLIMEGSDGGGYDVEMSLGAVPLYLQFKLSEHLKTNRAKEAQNHPDVIQAPYKRFAITSSDVSKQHEMLVALNQTHAHVFYSAPNFYTYAALNRFWTRGSVSDNTLYVRPNEIGPIEDGLRHTICFNGLSFADGNCFLFSKPKPVPALAFDRVRVGLSRALEEAKTPLRDLLPNWMEDLRTAREAGERLHEIRAAAVEKQRAEDRLAKEDSDATDVVERHALVSDSFKVIDPEPEAVALPRPRPIPLSQADEDRAGLSDFGREVATVFQAQAFILQAQS
ncbi:hypothetical protein [Litoreibacter roseus]|uniref:Uncharacterized protein n=1 Tax=Litoreibacter roseus TaxID=2601869 RepID=A0A6N6JLN6_9RHOB|nr:hypothetical protein [Litoreibacter roseus]GFE67034.1 hypothetical protein KIN_41080 [Litoreibacter roseus]